MSDRLEKRVQLVTLLMEAVTTAMNAHVRLRLSIEFEPELRGEELDAMRPLLVKLMKLLQRAQEAEA